MRNFKIIKTTLVCHFYKVNNFLNIVVKIFKKIYMFLCIFSNNEIIEKRRNKYDLSARR